MTMISIIVVIDDKGGMGKDNQLLCHLPADLKHFKALTLGKPIIMGRRTFDSIGKALPLRVNIVLSRHSLDDIEGVLVVDSLTEALRLTSEVPEVMVIGGAGVFSQALPLAGRIYLTHIHHQFSADVFFPSLDANTWVCEESIFKEHDEKNPYDMTFCRYKRA